MILLADWKLQHGSAERRIELFWGDLSYLPPEHAVDMLVVSAFPNDYVPTPTSLIGALNRNGISVLRLSYAKESDLREEFSCWISQPLVGVRSFRRILCIESGWRGTPPEIADDLFRAIAPCSISKFPHRSMAMPLIGAGDQGYPADQIMESILRTALAWFRRGLPIDVLKIVAYSDSSALQAKQTFLKIQREDTLGTESAAGRSHLPTGGEPSGNAYDVFLSYAHVDAEPAGRVHQALQLLRPEIRVFCDRATLQPGASWLWQVAESLDSARRVVALFTPEYWTSSYCKDEFCAAFIRQTDTSQRILFPIYLRSATIPYFFKTVQYADCREADMRKLSAACRDVCAAVQGDLSRENG